MLCRYERTIFKSDKGFCIFAYSTSDESVPKEARNRSYYHDDKIHFTAIGYHLIATDAVEVELDGTWENSKHGLQLSVSMCKEVVPRDQAGILAYLSSGIIKGIGPETAKAIVARFGDKTMEVLEKEPDWIEKKKVKELHVYADEDHVHLQKPKKEAGKKGKIVPLVSVTEGTESNGRRRKTICPMHFVDEHFDSKALWNTVEGYIQKAYAVDSIEKIYVHADGGGWIRSGLKDFAQTEHVLDGFHLEKYLRRISARFPKKNLRIRFCKAFEQNDRKKADQMLQELYAEAEGDKRQTKAVKEFGSYIRNNWEEIVRRKRLDIPGSCTEGQISHVLSERFSRDPMGWSEECLGKLSQARVYLKNGGTLTREDFKEKDEKLNGKEKYREYAQRMMKEAGEGCFDWSIFEKPIVPMDKASGTQILIESLGESRNILYC